METHRPSLRARLPALLTHGCHGLVLLVLVWSPLTLWRAHLESNLWIDETYSLLLVSHSPAQVVATTSADTHPPGYYLALKAWLKLARLAGHEPGILWARLLNVGAWLGLTLLVWWGGRRLAGRSAGTVVAWMVAGSAFTHLHARDLRSYAFATLGLLTVLGALAVLGRRVDRAPNAPAMAGFERTELLAWSVAAAGALLALWSHLLTAVALAALGLAWLGVWCGPALFDGDRRRYGLRLLAGGALASGITVLGFAPWLLRVTQQIGILERSGTRWMTPATCENLLSVFTFWLPFGRIGTPGPPENPALLSVLGAVAALLPFLVALGAWIRPSRSAPDDAQTAFVGRAALVSLGVGGLFVVTIWILDRLDLAPVFHGPRYPSLVAPLWAAGLAFLALWSARRLGRGPALAALLLLPLLACSATGQGLLAHRESTWGLVHWQETAPELFPPPGEPIYLMPSELVPFYRRSLGRYDLRRIEELPCALASTEAATVIDVNPWPSLDRTRDRLLRRLLHRGLLAASIATRDLPPGRDDVRVHRLAAPSPALAGTLCSHGLVSRMAREIAAAPARALPEGLQGRAWSFLEIGDDLTTARWATRDAVPVGFDGTLPAGDHVLHLVGERLPYPRPTVEIGLTLHEAELSLVEALPSGPFHLEIPLTLDHPLHQPVLVLEHPTWSPVGVGLSGDRRTLAFLFRAAWFEEGPGGRPAPSTTASSPAAPW